MKEDNISEYGKYESIVEKLQEKERTLFNMYYMHQKTHKDISKFYGVTQGTISKRLKSIRTTIMKEYNLGILNNRRPISYDDVIDLHNILKNKYISLDML